MCCSVCILSVVAMALVWLFIGALLLYYTWNTVICAQFSSRKNISYKNSLLFLFTVAILLAPCYLMKKRGGGAYWKKSCSSYSKHYGHRACGGKSCAHKGKRDCKSCHGKKDHYYKKKHCKDCDRHDKKQPEEETPAQ